MILHGNLMAAARALLMAPRPATPGLMAHLPETGDLLILALGDPLGGGAVLDLPPPSAAMHLHGSARTDLTPTLQAALLHGAGNAARAWQTRVDLAAPGLHRIVVEAPVGRDSEDRGLVQHSAQSFVLRGPAPATPEALGLTLEILPDTLRPEFLPGLRFSARVLARGRALGRAAVHLERVGAEPVAGQVRALPGSPAPLWLIAETDREGRFQVALPAPGLWAITASGPFGWSGLRPVRHFNTAWMRFGTGGDCLRTAAQTPALAARSAAAPRPDVETDAGAGSPPVRVRAERRRESTA